MRIEQTHLNDITMIIGFGAQTMFIFLVVWRFFDRGIARYVDIDSYFPSCGSIFSLRQIGF